MTRSSANSMAQGGSLSISEASTSMMMLKSRGLIADPCFSVYIIIFKGNCTNARNF